MDGHPHITLVADDSVVRAKAAALKAAAIAMFDAAMQADDDEACQIAGRPIAAVNDLMIARGWRPDPLRGFRRE